jgi:SOS-response transcriptional repressor LexA
MSHPVLDCPEDVFPEDVVCYLVAGQSMTGDGIRSGDYIVVVPGHKPADGEIAVVEYTTASGTRGRVVKHVRSVGGVTCGGVTGGMILESSNPAFPPSIITPQADPVIEGLVIGTGRQRDGTWEWSRFRPALAGAT